MKRETSTYERIMFFGSRFKPMYFAFHLKIQGIISSSDLKKTFNSLKLRFPSSSVKIVMDSDYKQFLTTDNVPEYPVSVEPSGADWRITAAAELSKRFDDCKGPMVKFSLIHANDTTELITFFQHSICDGISAVEFLKYLLTLLNNSETATTGNESRWAPHLTHCLKNDIHEQLQKCELPDWISKRNLVKNNYLPIPESIPFLEPTFDIKTLDLSCKTTDLIIQKAQQWGVSVHSLLGGCFLSVFASEFGRSLGYKRVIQSPVSFRRFMKEEFQNAFGLYMGIIKQGIDCSPGTDLFTVVKNIHSSFKKQIESTDTLKEYYHFMTWLLDNVEDPETFFYNGPGQEPMNYDFSISNLGRINFEPANSFSVIEAHGPVFSAVDGERIFGVCTVNGRIHITMIYDNNCFCSKRAALVLDKINRLLLALE